MQFFTDLLRWYFDVAPTASGEGIAWNLEFGRPLFGGATWIAAGIVAAVVVGVYWRDAARLPRKSRAALAGLRLLALALLWVVFCELTLAVTRTGLPFLPVLIDTSASMSLEDDYADASQQRAAAGLLSGSSGTRRTRLDLAKALLLRDDARLLRELQEQYRVRLFHFSASAEPVPLDASQDEDETALMTQAVRGLQAVGETTRPGPSLQRVLESFRGADPAAVLILTDGIASDDDEDRLSNAAATLGLRAPPLYPVAVGSAEPARDVELSELLADPVAFLNDPVTFAFRVRGFGYPGEVVRLRLRRAGAREVLVSQEIVLGTDGESLPVRLTFTPDSEGDYEFLVTAEPLEGEANTQNNVLRQRVRVRSEQIQVLLVERAPRWEYRHLKGVLERDRTVELRTVLQESDLAFEEEDRTALDRFPPTREELFAYDVILFGDVDLQYLNPGALDHVYEFVADQGGGIVFVAGETHNPIDYAGTPLEALLPIQLQDVATPSAPPTQPFRLELTRAGAAHPIFQLETGDRPLEEVWGGLPGMYWSLEAGRRKPGASVLAVHPTQHTQAGRSPLILLQRVGAGQVLFHATDELWQIRRRREDAFYGRYWSQAVRYLARSRLSSGMRGVEFTSDRAVYRPGEAVRLRVRFVDQGLIPEAGEPVVVVVERMQGERRQVELHPVETGSDTFEGLLTAPAVGTYHAWMAAPATEDAPPTRDFRVEAVGEELQKRAADARDLELAAELTGGQCLTIADAERITELLPAGEFVTVSRGRRIPLWSRWEVLVLFTGLVACEWLLRKRARLL